MSEQRVYIAQCLCPRRHCILATAGQFTEQGQADRELIRFLVENICAMIEEKRIDPWCGLCRAQSQEWKYEVGRTEFRTLEEAWPHLRAMEEANRRSAEAIRAAERAAKN